MKKKILFMILATSLLNCKEKTVKAEIDYLGEMTQDSHLADNNQTKLVKVDNLQIAFDFMSMAYHVRMMKLMKVEMKNVAGATHGLMVTIMNNKTKDIIKGAQVALSVSHPDGYSENISTEVMSGAGMYH